MSGQEHKRQIGGLYSFRYRWRLQSKPSEVPASFSYVIEGNRLRLPANPGGVRFAFPIRDVVETEEVIVVCLAVPNGSNYSENVFAVDHDGNLRWRIKPQSFASRSGPYAALSLSDGHVRLHGKDGQARDVDPKTGMVLGQSG
jgi:hypothetical protein